jgi:hypothetical protein
MQESSFVAVEHIRLLTRAASFRSRANTLSPSQRCIARRKSLWPLSCTRPARTSSSTVASPIQIAVIVLQPAGLPGRHHADRRRQWRPPLGC